MKNTIVTTSTTSRSKERQRFARKFRALNPMPYERNEPIHNLANKSNAANRKICSAERVKLEPQNNFGQATLVAIFEAGIRRCNLNKHVHQQMRTKFCQQFTKHRHTHTRTDKRMKVMETWRKNKNILTDLSRDNGNVIAILNESDYGEKIPQLESDEATYQPVKKYLTQRLRAEISIETNGTKEGQESHRRNIQANSNLKMFISYTLRTHSYT